ncbi:MAG: hypothetical protein ABL971_00100 [Vicinamibacterales bacterium]
MRRLASDCGVSQDRIVSHRPAAPDALVRLSAEYDIGLALDPAASENNDIALSNKMFAYLLAGNAVLATRTKGQSWLAQRLGPAVKLCEPGRPESWAAALRPWVEDAAVLDRALAYAWYMGETRFNWEMEKPVFLDVVAKALAGASANRAAS